MAFNKEKWRNGQKYNPDIPARHGYDSGTDNLAAVNTAGYFNSVVKELAEGDFIDAVVNGDATELVVDDIDDGVVTTVDFNAA